MSHASNLPGASPPEDRLESGSDQERSQFDETPDSPLARVEKELFDVLVATDVLLDTIDLEKLPDIVDGGKLRTLVDLSRLSEAISERNPDLVFDLSHLDRVVDRRELWNAVDLLEFAKAKRTWDQELEDVVGEDASAASESNSEAADDAGAFTASLRDEANGVLVHQEARALMEAIRPQVVEAHAAAERVYASNRGRSGGTRKRSVVGGATVVSLLPRGPLPNGPSTRLSTVPAGIPYSALDPLPRVYGYRWQPDESTNAQQR